MKPADFTKLVSDEKAKAAKEDSYVSHNKKLMIHWVRTHEGPVPAFGNRNTWDQIQKQLMEIASKPAELNSKICLSPLTYRKIHHLSRVSFGEIGGKGGKMQYGLRVREFQVGVPKKLVALSPGEVKTAAEKERELPAMADGPGDDDAKGDRIMHASAAAYDESSSLGVRQILQSRRGRAHICHGGQTAYDSPASNIFCI